MTSHEMTEEGKYWTEEFKAYATLSIEHQNRIKGKIMNAFKLLWDEKPDEELFCMCMSGVVIFPNVVYYMQANTVKDNEAKIFLYVT